MSKIPMSAVIDDDGIVLDTSIRHKSSCVYRNSIRIDLPAELRNVGGDARAVMQFSRDGLSKAENLFHRHQPNIALRRAPRRLRLFGNDRALL